MKVNLKSGLYLLFCILLLVYMVWPQPKSIDQFKVLPNSERSKLDGDTWQVPDVAAYFSNNYREFTVSFYQKDFKNLHHMLFPPFRLNYPPEFAFSAIKPYTDSTYLEEVFYPLKDSVFVNGFEPFYQNDGPKFTGAAKFDMQSHTWDTKSTLRFYPSSLWARLVVWFGVSLSIALLYVLGKRAFR